MNKIQTVYIAGALTPNGLNSVHPTIDYLENVNRMIRLALDCFFAGYDPFVPAFDMLFWFVKDGKEKIREDMIKRYSKTWVVRCDAVVLVDGWQRSKGTLNEILLANKEGIPVFKGLEKLQENRPTIINAESYLKELEK